MEYVDKIMKIKTYLGPSGVETNLITRPAVLRIVKEAEAEIATRDKEIGELEAMEDVLSWVIIGYEIQIENLEKQVTETVDEILAHKENNRIQMREKKALEERVKEIEGRYNTQAIELDEARAYTLELEEDKKDLEGKLWNAINIIEKERKEKKALEERTDVFKIITPEEIVPGRQYLIRSLIEKFDSWAWDVGFGRDGWDGTKAVPYIEHFEGRGDWHIDELGKAVIFHLPRKEEVPDPKAEEKEQCPVCGKKKIHACPDGRRLCLTCSATGTATTFAPNGKPDLKVELISGFCIKHQQKLIFKNGDMYCPGCYPDGPPKEGECPKCIHGPPAPDKLPYCEYCLIQYPGGNPIGFKNYFTPKPEEKEPKADEKPISTGGTVQYPKGYEDHKYRCWQCGGSLRALNLIIGVEVCRACAIVYATCAESLGLMYHATNIKWGDRVYETADFSWHPVDKPCDLCEPKAEEKDDNLNKGPMMDDEDWGLQDKGRDTY